MLDSYAAIFARRADSYCRAMNHHPHARDAEFGAVVDPLDPAARIVIDMPAGGGWLRRYLRAGIHYIAIEPAELFFDLCPQDASADRLRAPVEAVPLPDAAADAIVASLGGLFGDQLLNKEGIQALATMPSLDELRGKIIGLVQAPATKIAGVLAAPGGQLARVLNAYATKDAA